MPNKFPALRVEGTLDRRGRGDVRSHDRHRRARGHHRDARITTRRSRRCREQEIERVLWAFRDRVHDLQERHPASATSCCSRTTARRPARRSSTGTAQLIALPIVPDFVREELDGAKRHYRGQGTLRLLRHHAPGDERRPRGSSTRTPTSWRWRRTRRECRSRRGCCRAPRVALRGRAAAASREPGAAC